MKAELERIWKDRLVRCPRHVVLWHNENKKGGWTDCREPLLVHRRGKICTPRRKTWNKNA